MKPLRELPLQLFLLLIAGLGRLPIRMARGLIRPLAPVLRGLMRGRRRVVERNLALCFPQSSPGWRRATSRAHFRHLSDSLAETAVAWCRPGELDAGFGEVLGLVHLEAARARGQGILLLTGHATCMELAARILGRHLSGKAIYRPLRSPSLEAFQNQGRARYAEAMIPRDNVRAMVRQLRSGGLLWYAPDQDFGPDRSAFAPFFGIQTATATGLVELVRLGRATVLPMYPRKLADGRIQVHLEAPWDNYPSGDLVADLARYNAFLERHVQAVPAQYWWMHRRFKTAPDGTPDRYGREA